MSDSIAYVTHAKEPLRGSNFKDADAVILCLLSYLHYGKFKDRISLSEMKERADGAVSNTRVPDENKELLLACAESPRFANIRIDRFAEETDINAVKQFSAVTFFIDWETIFVAFRGTDGTIIGWQEDFELAFMDEIPAQGQAKSYLKLILAEYWWCHIIVGGHSKGGNLAVYSGMMQSEKHCSRIAIIYNLDGPGFKKDVEESLEFKAAQPKVIKIVPEYTVIGMLLQDETHYKVVKASANWLYQHDLYNWRIDDTTGNLTYIPAINLDAVNINKAIFHWLDHIDEKKRSIISESLFSIMKRTECSTVACVIENWKEHVIKLFLQYRKEDKKSRTLLRKDLMVLAKDIMAASWQNRDKDDRDKENKPRRKPRIKKK